MMFPPRVNTASLTLSLLVISNNIFANAEIDGLFSSSLQSLSSNLSPTLNGEFLLPARKSVVSGLRSPCHSVHPLPSLVPSPSRFLDRLYPVSTNDGIIIPQKMAHDSEAMPSAANSNADVLHKTEPSIIRPADQHEGDDVALRFPSHSDLPTAKHPSPKRQTLVPAYVPPPIPSTPPQPAPPPAYLHNLRIQEYVETFQ